MIEGQVVSAERGEPGRDLPPEIMTVLCASLDTLHPAEVKAATQIVIDTGRRPEDILGLPLDCLARDKDGAAVLVYDNAKAHRLGRRLPVSQATATVITGQQARHHPRGRVSLWLSECGAADRCLARPCRSGCGVAARSRPSGCWLPGSAGWRCWWRLGWPSACPTA